MNIHSCKHDKEWILRYGEWWCEGCNMKMSQGEMLLWNEINKLKTRLFGDCCRCGLLKTECIYPSCGAARAVPHICDTSRSGPCPVCGGC